MWLARGRCCSWLAILLFTSNVSVDSIPTVVNVCRMIDAHFALIDLGEMSPNPVVESVVIVK